MNMKNIIFTVCAATLLTACSTGTPKPGADYKPESISAQSMANMSPEMINSEMHEAQIDRVLFGYDSSAICDEAKVILDKQIQIISNIDGNIIIEGHADERGTRDYNIGLGERRAEAVKNYLVSHGVPADKLAVISYGKERPAVEGHDQEAWRQNRRAMIVVEASENN